MKHLGAMLNISGSCDDEVEQRIGVASNLIGAMRKQALVRRELKKLAKCDSIMPWFYPQCCMDVRHGRCRDDMRAGCEP